MKDPKQTIENMRERARQLGLGELNILMVQFFEELDPRPFGFDAAVQFPPNLRKNFEYPLGAYDGFSGIIYDYSEVMNLCLASEANFVEYQGVMPGWDNTPRKGGNAHIYYGESAEKFFTWMNNAWEKMIRNIPDEDDKVLFINAWNEWGEGAHLERGHHDRFDALELVRKVFEEKFSK
jgi:hypothetical protein